MRTQKSDRSRAGQGGIALIATLVALSLLLALAVPFVLSMSFGESVSFVEVDQKTVELASASARDSLLATAALGHSAIDPSPRFDDLLEYPDRLELPEAFAPLSRNGRVLMAGETWDLQRLVNVNSCSPLLLANLLGTLARLREELTPESSEIIVSSAAAFPESGFLWIDHELIHYGARTDAVFTDLTRGMFGSQGFVGPEDRTLREGTLVLDYRVIVAVTWPFDERFGGDRTRYTPYASVGELARSAEAGFGGFSTDELEELETHCTVDSARETAPTWGRPERVFNDLMPGLSKTLRVRSALHLGAGSVVRIRSLADGATEYALVMSTANPRGLTDLNLASEYRLGLLKPVTQEFPGMDTVVEPLLPHPININTASEAVLGAVFAEVRRAVLARVHDGDQRQRTQPEKGISRREAFDLAGRIVALRGGDEVVAGAPFRGWRDVVERLFAPILEEIPVSNFAEKNRWIRLYQNLLTGRDGVLEMGTLPLCFASGPRVGYRAAAAYERGLLSRSLAARMERQGVAVVMPGMGLDFAWDSQEALDEAFRLDRRASFYLTLPTNTSALSPQSRGDDPASRYFPHLIATAFPTMGLGQSRFPSPDSTDSGFQSAPASTPPTPLTIVQVDSFSSSLDPLGRNIGQENVYLMRNIGPRDRTPDQQQRDGDHSRIQFPFTVVGGVAGRFGVSLWAQPEDLGNQILFDYSDGDDERNRIAVMFRDGNLVLELLDEAGLDPAPGTVPTSPERSAAEWSVPIAELGLQPGVPVHVNLACYGNRSGELSLLIDGVVRSKPKYLTYLASPLPVYDPINSGALPGQESERYIDIYVETTESFPPQGVLRIGLELFEYTSIEDGVFHCRYVNSMGGRVARMSPREYRPAIPVDAQGRPTVSSDELGAGVNLDVAPEHPVGAAVELYGYSTSLYRDSILQVGGTTLAEPLGAFAVARGYLRNAVNIDVQGPIPPGRTITVGVGLDETTQDDIELADPLTSERYPPEPADDRIASAFPESGGYALLVQQRITLNFQQGPGTLPGESTPTGGVEVIRYGSRQGTKLRNIQRAVRLPGNDRDIDSQYYDGSPKKFVAEWEEYMMVSGGPGTTPQRMKDIPTYMLFVVPISIAVQSTDALVDPSALGYSEWVQILPQGADESETEWVRYDTMMDRRHLVRGNRRAWELCRFALTRQSRALNMILNSGGGVLADPAAAVAAIWGQPASTSGYIGYIDKIEEDYPPIQAARRALDFRGDPFTGTTSHAHLGAATVLPTHRMELDWGNYGALSARAGRNDRVALVNGSIASGTSRPIVEWHTVNWVARRFNGDNVSPQNQPSELLGPYPFQLVGLKDRVANVFQGPVEREDFVDTRLVDRMVKFPSGELPSAYIDEVPVGAGAGGRDPLRGVIDEVVINEQRAEDLVLEEPFDETAMEFRVRPDLRLRGYGVVGTAEDLSAPFPPGGGLVQIDGEILAYMSRDDGLFQVAVNGRGLLNTDPRGHDRGTRVRFLTHVPAAILSGGVQPDSYVLPVQALGGMPAASGTALLGQELLHYTWSRRSGDQIALEMPRWFPPEDEDSEGRRGRGLFRGRYGTAPQGASSGEPVIFFPCRYWDRFRPRADDPEMAFFQVTHSQAPVYFSGIYWEEEIPDGTVDVHCYVRIDGRGSFADDPDRAPSLFLHTSNEAADRALPLGRQGTTLEARFVTVYAPGAFDPATFIAQGWKTAPRIENVRIQYEGEARIIQERITAR